MEHYRAKFNTFPWFVPQESVIRIPNDPALAQVVARFLAEHAVVSGRCDPGRETQITIALVEAITNAIVHGNLEISSELRDTEMGEFNELIERRKRELPYRDRVVEVRVALQSDGVLWTVSDEGNGFDAASVPDPTTPENLLRCSGRGLLLMKSFCDEVSWSERGNQVRMQVIATSRKHASPSVRE